MSLLIIRLYFKKPSQDGIEHSKYVTHEKLHQQIRNAPSKSCHRYPFKKLLGGLSGPFKTPQRPMRSHRPNGPPICQTRPQRHARSRYTSPGLRKPRKPSSSPRAPCKAHITLPPVPGETTQPSSRPTALSPRKPKTIRYSSTKSTSVLPSYVGNPSFRKVRYSPSTMATAWKTTILSAKTLGSFGQTIPA